MDGHRFDELTRTFSGSRRDALKALGGGALAALGLARAGDSASADDTCKPATPLPQAKCTKDAQCCKGLVCDGAKSRSGPVCQAGCHITINDKVVFFASGTANPDNQCQSCQPGTSTTSWTNKASGTACDDGDPCTFDDRCTGGVCGGTPYTCTPGECQATASCNGDGTCSFTNVAFGTPTAGQTPGDCQKNVCDGAGGVTSVADDTDVPADDGNPCTAEVCVNGVPAHPAKLDGTSCGAGLTCCSGACVNLQTDPYNCGACGNDYCPRNFGNTECRNGTCCIVAGACDPTPEPPYPACCSGVCSSDAQNPNTFCRND